MMTLLREKSSRLFPQKTSNIFDKILNQLCDTWKIIMKASKGSSLQSFISLKSTTKTLEEGLKYVPI